MPDAKQHDWHWGKQMLACFDDLRDEFAMHDPPIVDREVIPPFSGDHDGMVIWLICDGADGVSRLSASIEPLTARLRSRMTDRGFPSSALQSLYISFTSLADIESGGGRFYFFR